MEQLVEKKKKKIVPPRTHSAKEMYEWYKQKNKDTRIPYWMFKEVLARFNKKASDAVIFGQVLNLGSRLGSVIIKKISRNYKKPMVDWGASKARRKELEQDGVACKTKETPNGEEWLIFHTSPWYLRWAWFKKRACRVKNQTVYKFIPTSNKSKKAGEDSLDKLGNKGKLTLAQKLNPTLHYIYSQPIKDTSNGRY